MGADQLLLSRRPRTGECAGLENAGGAISFARNAEGWWRANLTYSYWYNPYLS